MGKESWGQGGCGASMCARARVSACACACVYACVSAYECLSLSLPVCIRRLLRLLSCQSVLLPAGMLACLSVFLLLSHVRDVRCVKESRSVKGQQIHKRRRGPCRPSQQPQGAKRERPSHEPH
eukprot:6183047-Pleurochrysis_carterae.AAC.1